jgi:hypothetical protein
MGNEKNVIPEGAVEVTVEELVTSYAIGMDEEQLLEAQTEMGINNIGPEDLMRICIAQTWVIKDIMDGPLAGVKFYREEGGEGLH